MDAVVDRQPLHFPLARENAVWEQWAERLVWAFVAVGVALRVGRYALHFPLWGDELMLASSFLDRGFLDMLRPLDCYMCSPILFLWSEWIVVKAGGFSEWTLRLVPLVSSLVGLFVFRHVARRLMTGIPLVTAVGIFAVAYYPIRHAAELRAYASDLTIALAFLAMAVEWWREPTRSRWLWAQTVFAPFAVGFSFPAVFAGGAVTLGLAYHVWKFGDRGSKIAFATYNVVLVGSFLFFMKLAFAAQLTVSGAVVTEHWLAAFPPREPWPLLVWLVQTFTGEIVAYPLGGDNFGSILTTIGCVVGAVVLCRTGRAALAGVFGGLLALGLVAAALHRYPFGGEHPTQFLAGYFCLFAGLGGGYLICAITNSAMQRRAVIATTGALAVIGCGLALLYAVRPYKHPEDQHHRDFARWFWQEAADGAEVVCLWSDEGRDLGTPKPWDYLAFQRIYSKRHHRGETTTIAETSGKLRCVTCERTGMQHDPQKIDAWLTEMSAGYRLVGRTDHSVRVNGRHMPEDIVTYEVFEFVPKDRVVVETAQRAR